MNKEHPEARSLPTGTFVSIRVLAPTKGLSKWKPGFQVLSSTEGGGLRLVELDSGRIVRLNQQDVREIPTPLPYEEVDPLPGATHKKTTVGSVQFLDFSVHHRSTGMHHRSIESNWNTWLTKVSRTCNHSPGKQMGHMVDECQLYLHPSPTSLRKC